MNGATFALTLVRSGPLSLVVDRGRRNLAHQGLTSGAAMDMTAFYWANRLCANDPEEACIETLGGLEIISNALTTLAVTGADAEIRVNGERKARYTRLKIRANDRLTVGVPERGMRVYIAVSGGLQTPSQLGSRTTVMREKLGGLGGNGVPLRENDKLALIDHPYIEGPMQLPETERPRLADNLLLRVVEGYQAKRFSALHKARFYAGCYRVTEKMDRMGIRLDGPGIPSDVANLTSEGMTLGAVQIPPDGQPIVMMSDRQTIGGYPKLGSVLSLDCDRLAQAKPQTRVSFSPVTIEDAHNILTLEARRRERLILNEKTRD